jgi:predicted nucleotidyltransferase
MDEAIREVLQGDDRIAFGLIFGSAARDQLTPFSDIDVAVGLRAGVSFSATDIGALVSRLEAAAGRDVDLVILNEAPPGLAYRVFRDGRLIIEADRAARVARQARAIVEYLDFKPFEERFARAVLRRAAHGR